MCIVGGAARADGEVSLGRRSAVPLSRQRTPQLTENGKISHARCEVAIVDHCNLACRACSHLSPILPRHELTAEALERDLSRLWRHYESAWVALLGGEPLLHRDLVGVIEAAHRAAP